MIIEPILYTYANPGQRQILIDVYAVKPFAVETIKVERIFADKIFAAEFYYEREKYFDTAKHLYDVAVMMNLPNIHALIRDRATLLQMIGYKRLEETRRMGSDLSGKKFRAFSVFKEMQNNAQLADFYKRMQTIYVFKVEDVISFDAVTSVCELLTGVLYELDNE